MFIFLQLWLLSEMLRFCFTIVSLDSTICFLGNILVPDKVALVFSTNVN